MENIMLSICMIVKNEQRCLERCLKSLAPLREQINCEVIVTDTGSTYNTLEIAEKYADKILHFKWCDDFSAARNVGMEEAKGEWILVIDADEELVEDVSHLVKFFNSEERNQYAGAFLTEMNCSNAEMCNQCKSLKDYTGASSIFLAYRLFRANLKPRYVGIIHEYVPYKEPFYTFALTLYHDGYAFEDEAKRRQKRMRNASLLQKKLKENLHDLRTIIQIMREREVIKKDIYEKLVLLEEDIAYKNLKSDYAPVAFRQIASYYYEKKEFEKVLKICKDFLHFFNKDKYEIWQMDIRYLQANCLFQQKQYEPTIKISDRYIQLMDKYRNNKLDSQLLRINYPTYLNREEFMQHLQSKCYMELNEVKKAGELIKKVNLKKVTGNGLYNLYWVIVRLSHIKESDISLKEYYPLLLEIMESESAQRSSAKNAYNMIHSYIAGLPEEKRNILLEQISSFEKKKDNL